MTTEASLLQFRELGIVDYESTWTEMNVFTRNRNPQQKDECWLLQHYPVFTLGQAGKPEHILNPHQIPVVNTDRGGQVTFHGPGQLVAYLMVDIKRRKMGIRQLVDLIENSIIELLDSYGITAVTRKGAPGVYVGESKIAALGLRIKQGCSYHGLSLNIDMDLEPFSYINPCGYPGQDVTQLADLLEKPPASLFEDAGERFKSVLNHHLL